MPYWHHDWHMTGWHFMWMALWWTLILAGIAWIIWSVNNRTRPVGGPDQETPEMLLKKRYARGEIDTDEYRRKLNELRE